MAILYEITGYQGQIPEFENPDFWANYANFKNSSSRQFDDLLDGINNLKVSLNDIYGDGLDV